MKRPIAFIAGTGFAAPQRIVTNDDLAAEGIDTSDEWIRERTGIRQRHISSSGETLTVLASSAAQMAMEEAGITADQVDVIIVGTATPDHLLPSSAVEIQAAIHADHAMAFDISAACSGWLYSVQVAEGLIASGMAETVLTIGAEVLSSIIDWKDRNTCVLFGDGAGATVIRHAKYSPERNGQQAGILSCFGKSDGKLAELLWRPAGGVVEPFSEKVISDRRQYVHMQGREVFRHAVRSMSEATDRALEKANLSASDIDLLIPHQANMRIIEATAKHAGIDMSKVFVNVDRFGNTSAASIPIALADARKKGLVPEGTLVLFAAFGAGLTWGSLVVRF